MHHLRLRFLRRLVPLVALALAVPLAIPLAGCGGTEVTAPVLATVEGTTFAPALGIDLSTSGWTKTASGLYYRTLKSPAASAATVTVGRSVSARYTGWLANGTQFGTGPITFTVGVRDVIAGWDEGVVGMRVGEQRRFLIPPALGYGAAGSGTIPGNAVLVFDIEVLSAT